MLFATYMLMLKRAQPDVLVMASSENDFDIQSISSKMVFRTLV